MRESLLAKILRYMIYVTAFMPLIIFSQYISPFHFGKIVVFRSIVEVMFALYLILWWGDRSYRPRTSPIFWAFLAFAGAFTLTTLTSVHPYLSVWGSLERMGGLWSFWHYFIFFVVITSVLRTQEHWITFLKCSIIAAVLSAFYGFGQKTHASFFIGSGDRERIFGTIGNAALFAGYEIVNVFLALTLFLRPGNSNVSRWIYGSGVVFGTLAVIMTVVRGSILGLGAGMTLFAFWYFLRFNSMYAKRSLLAFFTLALVGLAVLLTPIKDSQFVENSRFLRRLADTSFEQTTAKTRFWAWEAGLKGWSESIPKMVVGWGPENFNVPFSKYFNPQFFTGYGSETLFDRAHNMFVEILVTMGLLGLLTYLSIFWAVIHTLKKVKNARPENYIYYIGITSLLVAYIIHNAFIFDTSANLLIFFSVVAFVTFLGERGSNENLPIKPEPQRTGVLRMLAGAALILLAIIIAYRTNVQAIKANYASTRGIIRGWEGNFPGAVEKFREAMRYDVAGKYEIRNRFAQYVLEYSSSRELNSEIESAINIAIEEVTKNKNDFPQDYLPELYLSRLHIVLGRNDPASPHNDLALQHSLRALEISPTFIRTFYEVGQAYLNKKEYDKAIEYFKRAVELNPAVGVSYWYWGIVELSQGNTAAGLPIIQKALAAGYAASEDDYLRLAEVYVKQNDYVHLAQVYERLVKINTTKAQYFASLAVVYANLGRIDEAVEMARKAVILDPGFLQEAQNFARQLGRTL